MADNSSNNKSKTPQPTKVIEVGTFHQIFDGSKSGHPGYIIWKNEDHNLYLAIKFGTTSNKNNTKMNYSIRKGDKENLYYTKPFLGKRKNFGKNVLTEMDISEEKLQEILAEIDFLNPSYSSDISSKDRYQFKRNIKNPLITRGNCPTLWVQLTIILYKTTIITSTKSLKINKIPFIRAIVRPFRSS